MSIMPFIVGCVGSDIARNLIKVSADFVFSQPHLLEVTCRDVESLALLFV